MLRQLELSPLLSKIPLTISKQLFKIKVQGRLGDIKFKREPVPVLVEPLKELVDHMKRVEGTR
jgi:hypothetical protein